MKLKRKSGLTAGIIALSAVAITSVGFASWVISSGDSAVVSGTIEVDEVSPDNHEILHIWEKRNDAYVAITNADAVGGSSSQKIQFGAPATNNSTGWLTYKAGEGSVTEQLTAEYFFEIKGVNSLDFLNARLGINKSTTTGLVGGKGVATTKTGYEGAEELSLVTTAPTIAVSALTSAEQAYTFPDKASSGTFVAKVTITFNWGSLFTLNAAVVNPYAFYNDKVSSATDTVTGLTWAKHAENYLTALDNLLSGVTYSIKFASYATAAERNGDYAFDDVKTADEYKVVVANVVASNPS